MELPRRLAPSEARLCLAPGEAPLSLAPGEARRSLPPARHRLSLPPPGSADHRILARGVLRDIDDPDAAYERVPQREVPALDTRSGVILDASGAPARRRH
jgi:hypothetical protein